MGSSLQRRRLPEFTLGTFALGVVVTLAQACGLLSPLDAVNETIPAVGGAGGDGSGGNANGGATATGGEAGGASTDTGGSNSGAGSGGSAGTATGGAGPVLPVRNGLTVWLDAHDLGQGGTAVASWRNLAVGESDATQIQSEKQPDFVMVDGRPGVQFAGDEWMAFEPGFSDFRNGISIVAVARFDVVNRCHQLFQVCNGVELHDISLHGTNDDDPGRVLFEVKDEAIRGLPYMIAEGDIALVSVVVGVNGAGELAVDAEPAGMAAPGTALIPEQVVRERNYLGAGLYSDCISFQGVIFEFLLYERGLSKQDELDPLIEHLRNKWSCCGG